MKAIVLRELTSVKQDQAPLSFTDMPEPVPGQGEVLLRVTRCGVCHTELDEIEGRTPPPHLPVILGHQVVGIVEDGVQNLPILELQKKQSQEPFESLRVGVAWIASTCGHCEY